MKLCTNVNHHAKKNFFDIGIDQAHKQNNKLVKIDESLLDNAKALLRWSVAGPVFSAMCKNPEQKNNLQHHENNKFY